MEKANYNIALHKTADNLDKNTITGYVFTAAGVRFGVSNIDRFGEKDCKWTITELTTGYRVIDGKSRKDAITNLLKTPHDKWEAMRKVIAKCMVNLNESIIPVDTFYSVYPTAG